MMQIEALTTDQTGTELANVQITVDAGDVALLPKSARLSKSGYAFIQLRTNGVNGGVNETGIKRIKAILKTADKNGIGVVFVQPTFIKDELNAPLWGSGMRYITRPELEALI